MIETEVVVVETNAVPEIFSAEAGCFYDPYSLDDILWFEAFVDDRDGIWDITEVWADVYDAWTDEVIESFPLYASSDPNVFFSDWYASTTLTNCASPDWNVDIVVYDDMGDWTAVYVEPYAYGVTF